MKDVEGVKEGASALAIETHGTDRIPDAERTASLFDFLRVEWSGANSLATAVLGALPIMLGLSFWQALAATTIGLVVGSAILAPMAVFGAVTGTNNAVASSAHFGVVGRIVGSFLSLLVAIAFFAISVWSSGDALIGAFRRLTGHPGAEWMYAAAYGLFAAAIFIVCIIGFQLMLLISKIATVALTTLILIAIFAIAPQFNAGYAGAGLTTSDPAFLPLFVTAILVVLANPISFGAFLGDWSRYVPASTSRWRLMMTSFIAQLLTFPPFLLGLMAASVVAEQAPSFLAAGDFTGGLLSVAPSWSLLPLLALAFLSGMSTGTTSLYGTGLDFSSVIPSLTRARATALIGLISIALIFIGRFAFSLVGSINTFVALIIVTTTPWIVIMVQGYIFRRGFYLPDDMQVFNYRKKGGAYWFSNGWNIPAMLAWGISGAAGLMTMNLPGQFVGWLGHLAGGVDISLLVGLIVPALLYPLLLMLMPEPGVIYSPRGPRFVRVSQAPIAPVVDE
ncbi:MULTISPECIES: purine-cytosine permease family protein [unclassified Sphingobium]|uniref:purine-cytosine permease family protein n=1 Tax=unclassified Sphingobium TaxID=2611147 RepID=UPI00222551CB|nr:MULTISPECIES: cytosine permease [unclassified Sphingobium]MCW2395768.1 purine-cytosine permease-like protein [Sphingobium sp. B8D3B]MCW2419283.1 purine-cytosine permease-like protein [Sphingobium sp. B8D3C]